LRSFRTKITDRRRVYLSLASQIESQLREAYDLRYREKKATQAGLADKLRINRSAVHRRLTGRTNMTIETIADMVWALGHRIKVSIYDPACDQDGARFPEQATETAITDSVHRVSQPTIFSGHPARAVCSRTTPSILSASAT
jgi:DNA-binding phage protein